MIGRVVAVCDKTSAQTVAANAIGRINFDTVTYDPFNVITTGASWVFTAPRSGWYIVQAQMRFQSAAWTAGEEVYLQATGGAVTRQLDYHMAPATVNRSVRLGGSAGFYLSASQTLYVFLINPLGNPNCVLTTTSGHNHLYILHGGG